MAGPFESLRHRHVMALLFLLAIINNVNASRDVGNKKAATNGKLQQTISIEHSDDISLNGNVSQSGSQYPIYAHAITKDGHVIVAKPITRLKPVAKPVGNRTIISDLWGSKGEVLQQSASAGEPLTVSKQTMFGELENNIQVSAIHHYDGVSWLDRRDRRGVLAVIAIIGLPTLLLLCCCCCAQRKEPKRKNFGNAKYARSREGNESDPDEPKGIGNSVKKGFQAPFKSLAKKLTG